MEWNNNVIENDRHKIPPLIFRSVFRNLKLPSQFNSTNVHQTSRSCSSRSTQQLRETTTTISCLVLYFLARCRMIATATAICLTDRDRSLTPFVVLQNCLKSARASSKLSAFCLYLAWTLCCVLICCFFCGCPKSRQQVTHSICNLLLKARLLRTN